MYMNSPDPHDSRRNMCLASLLVAVVWLSAAGVLTAQIVNEEIGDNDLLEATETQLEVDDAVTTDWMDVEISVGIVTLIERRYANNPWLAGRLIRIQIKDGRVTLSGVVDSASEKSIANVLAWVAGVHEVDDSRLEVKPWLRRWRQRDGMIALRNDAEITQAVHDAFLYDPRLRGTKITVHVRQGQLSLLGEVASLSAKRAAGDDARNTLGVREVLNHLEVRPEQWPGDPAIDKRVAAALGRDAHVGMLAIQSSSHFGKVYLNGTVNSYFEKERAEAVTANVPGVIDVVNRLSVDFTWMDKADWEIKEDVERQLFWSPFVDSDQITVSVDDGIVTLKGTVHTHQQRDAAEENARQGGARRVVNQLDVPAGDNNHGGHNVKG